ncbi:maleate cis-trans isomerase [Patulibacter sp. NPDC049589]|uniref:maleate cis-trans isomerase family protein n=1 Tax=Patulibacter sp. NPDC049589 TaxID=3154731 RepID=UPI00342CE598
MTAERHDGWSARFRLGVIVPHADVGPEAELQAMAPPEVTVHAGRVHFSAMRAGGVMDPKIPHDPVLAFVEPPLIDDAVELLADAPLDVIALGFTSSAYKLGREGEGELLRRLERRSRGIPLISGGSAASDALRALDVQRLALVHPPWFDEELDALGARYFGTHGFDVTHHGPAPLPSDQSAIGVADVADVVDAVAELAGDADGVFIAGNGFRAAGAIADLEERLGVPVVTANQVLLWRALRGVDGIGPIRGFGRLLAGERVPV